ncbi:signal peptidase I [Romboutsia sp.]|uniref:signal peptidase I n=1 Tax=Romboutsia sp. TaxID=1965302 RepID=UPI003F2ECCD4
MLEKIKDLILDLLKSVVIAIIMSVIILQVAQPTKVSGQSMYPTLENEDSLIINKIAYNNKIPSRGDIVVFQSHLIDEENNKPKRLVKRVIGLPKEHIQIRNGEVYVNGKILNEDYIEGAYTMGKIDNVVEENHIFVMGDNRFNSLDSRDSHVGMVSIDNIIGKISFRTLPFSKFGKIE